MSPPLALLLTATAAASPAALAAPAGLAPRADEGPPGVYLSVVLLADDATDPRREATATRRLLEMTHSAGVWPVQLAVTPASLTAMLSVDADLGRLLVDLKPTLLLVGPPPRDGGLRDAALLGDRLGVVPALGAGVVGDLLREDTPLLASARALEAEGLVVAGGLIPPGRLAAGRPDPDAPAADIDRWRAAWATAQADAAGVQVPLHDAEVVLADLARLAALSSSLGQDPFVVPGVADRLRADLRRPLPPHAWSATPLRPEVASLAAAMERQPAVTLARLQESTATLARFVLGRSEPAAELGARLAELPPDARYRATQVLRARDLRPGPHAVATEARLRATTLALGDLAPRLTIDPARLVENRAQWTHLAPERWLAVFEVLPHSAGKISPQELDLLHRDFKRRDLRRRARSR